MKEKILISSCLIGQPVRYNGTAKQAHHPVLTRWQNEGRLVPVCPELAAGFSVPRSPSEIADNLSGEEVLNGTARIVTDTGQDVTSLFLSGARIALALAQQHKCRYAILTDNSPSCGSTTIYDGTFSGKTHPGTGATAALLRQNGVEVFSHTDIGSLQKRIDGF
ncbi:DUF523 domain-containing protein [Acetobacter musti]|uniref:DUF523 domain-containing protein n=1 Tax=Acetobacter musti TaxID=864732 RepID=A0ABX0JQ75_9PROT|nr:DUF523 domain-containing protein [Acetobacter musti]NHN84035.1 DUF523 domain-containing protein [Acetobacter musti]